MTIILLSKHNLISQVTTLVSMSEHNFGESGILLHLCYQMCMMEKNLEGVSGTIRSTSLPHNFALTLNVDWFQPFKHTQYSVGAMYVSILNLPRAERYSNEIIPGPKEPKENINSYLCPFVNEFLELWTGVIMKNSSGVQVLVRAALICNACDIPASRKVAGFLGHNAHHACTRCLTAFLRQQFGDKSDYTGTDCVNWPPRSLQTHRQSAIHHHKSAESHAKQKEIELCQGCRYSVLIELPYSNNTLCTTYY